MPVEEIAVHEKVKAGADFRYGCHSLTRERPWLRVQDGWLEDGRANHVYFEDTMSRDCRHPEYETDAACQGCTAERDNEFIALYWRRKAEEVRQVLQSTVRSSDCGGVCGNCPNEEADWYAELNRGYAQDRI